MLCGIRQHDGESSADEWEAPLLLSSYVKRGLYSVGAEDSLLWVRLRIVPPDRQNLLGTAEAADLLRCTRQNIQDLVKRGRLQPVMELSSGFLFLRGDVEELNT